MYKPVAEKDLLAIDTKKCLQALIAGADWLADTAQIKDSDEKVIARPRAHGIDRYPYTDVAGAMKTDYQPKRKQWWLFGTCWHTGQAIRALLKAYRLTDDNKYLESAVFAGEFLRRIQVMDQDSPLFGMLQSFEDEPYLIQASTAIEALPGLYDLYRQTGDEKWKESFRLAAEWLADKSYDGGGLFKDMFDVRRMQFMRGATHGKNVGDLRPLIDGPTMYLAYKLLDDEKYLEIFREIADLLVQEQDCSGMWLKYHPSAQCWNGHAHPRVAFWWGQPMLKAYDAFNDEKYLSSALRAAQWYIDVQNKDGGFYKSFDIYGNHDSFILCTSASPCSIIFWLDIYRRFGDQAYLGPILRSLEFTFKAQFTTEASDPNLHGAFFENLLPPDGTDVIPIRVRDIATTFSIRALADLIEFIDEKTENQRERRQ